MSEPGGRPKPQRQQNRLIWLVYGVVGLVAAVLFAQHLGVPGMQLSASESPPRSQVTAPTERWQRISLRTREDLDSAFPVLLDFIEHPENALSLRELTIDFGQENYCVEDDAAGLELQALSAQEQKLMEAVKSIDLGSELENKIIEALLWKARGLDTPGESGFSNQACMSRCLQSNRRLEYADAAAILFCSLSPNLSSLRTTEPGGTLSKFLLAVNYRWASSQSTDSNSPLANLARVQLIDRDSYDILNDERFYRNSDPLSFIQHFHHLPSLTTFDAYTISDSRSELDVLPPGLSSLKSISITHSDLSSQTMCGLIRLATSLEAVHFSTGGRATNDGGHAVLYPKSLGKCLEQHRTTLRSIDLDLDAYVWARDAHLPADVEQEDFADHNRHARDEEHLQDTLESYRSAADAGWRADEEESRARGYALFSRDLPDTKKYGSTIGSFAAFETLESLKIGIKLLLGSYDGWGEERLPPEKLVDMLPRSLTHLTIRGYREGRWEEHDKHVDQLRQEMATKLPALVSVRGLDCEIPGGEDVDDVDAEDAPLYVEPPVEDGWLLA